MKLHYLRAAAPPELGLALEEFEAQFRYPLGPESSFSISHGRDYVTFFAAIGDATVLVAEVDGKVVATIACVLRPLRFPSGQERTVVYLADLKVAPSARGGMVLARVFKALDRYLHVRMGYGIVMDGTGSTPLDYTGRGPFPAFTREGAITVLKLGASPGSFAPVSQALFEASHAELVGAGFVPLGGRPELRSELEVTPLAGPGACGLVEDTRRGKRLLVGPGEEIRAAHLSRLAFRTPAEGAALIRQACHRCAEAGVPNLFVALSEGSSRELLPLLGDLRCQVAPATIYGCGLPESGSEWWVDSAEI